MAFFAGERCMPKRYAMSVIAETHKFWKDLTGVEKRRFLRVIFTTSKTIDLPRQAQDRHRKQWTKRAFSAVVNTLKASGSGMKREGSGVWTHNDSPSHHHEQHDHDDLRIPDTVPQSPMRSSSPSSSSSSATAAVSGTSQGPPQR